MKILIVDDIGMNLKLLRAVLEGEGFAIVQASDGVEALAVLEREPVDAIISDILMPRMDGYRFCHEVRKNEKWKALPFIFHTSTYISPGDEKLCYDVGGDVYLRKPASREQLVSTLKKLTELPKNRSSDTSALGGEIDVMKEYNERLVFKLEEKNSQLEQARTELMEANQELEWRVEQRTAELQVANEELESFCASVSHDLRGPIRYIAGYAEIVMRDCASKLDESNLHNLRSIHHAAEGMGHLVDALMELAKVTRAEMKHLPVDLSALAAEVMADLKATDPDRRVDVVIAPGLNASGDPVLFRVLLVNLLGNAWKFTRKRSDARIEFGRTDDAKVRTFFVRDNGAGFDMNYVNKLFHPFQRLHAAFEFEGSGIGLATVQRIVFRHNGTVRAESPGHQGATFYFTLGGNEGVSESPAANAPLQTNQRRVEF